MKSFYFKTQTPKKHCTLFKVTMAETTMENLHDYTSDFLVPFAAASAMENDGSDSSPWMIR